MKKDFEWKLYGEGCKHAKIQMSRRKRKRNVLAAGNCLQFIMVLMSPRVISINWATSLIKKLQRKRMFKHAPHFVTKEKCPGRVECSVSYCWELKGCLYVWVIERERNVPQRRFFVIIILRSWHLYAFEKKFILNCCICLWKIWVYIRFSCIYSSIYASTAIFKYFMAQM